MLFVCLLKCHDSPVQEEGGGVEPLEFFVHVFMNWSVDNKLIFFLLEIYLIVDPNCF